MADVILVRLGSLRKTALSDEESWYEHLGLGYCAAALREAGFKTCIIDAVLGNWTDNQVVAQIVTARPRMVGLTVTFEFLMDRVADFAHQLREHYDCHITVGGHFPTFADVDILRRYPAISSVVRGEGEQTIVELMHVNIQKLLDKSSPKLRETFCVN